MIILFWIRHCLQRATMLDKADEKRLLTAMYQMYLKIERFSSLFVYHSRQLSILFVWQMPDGLVALSTLKRGWGNYFS